MKIAYVWVVVCAALIGAGIVAAVMMQARVRRSVWPAYVQALPVPARQPIVHSPGWPVHDTTCHGDEACLLARYRNAHAERQAMEVGALEVSLGEALAGAGPLLAAISPPAGTTPSVAACNSLSNTPVTVPGESLRRPQRDCYFMCLDSSLFGSQASEADVTDCVRRNKCASEPVLDGEWRLLSVVPRLGCLAQLREPPPPPFCAGLPETVDEERAPRACSPQQLCAHGVDMVPSGIEPFVQAPHHKCALRPAQWSCTEITMHFPRAACQFGN